jgi:acyl-CoA thioesterase
VESAPYFQLLQIRLEQIETGFARFRMPFRKELTQAYGMVHGGAIASLADTAVAFALLTIIQPGERVTTAEFKINFFAAVTDGEMVGEARVVHAGKRLVSADMEVKSQDGKLIAKGIATYAIIGTPKKKEE